MRRLTARGYALWDVVAESERKGSLDADIKNATFVNGLFRDHGPVHFVYHLAASRQLRSLQRSGRTVATE